MESGKIKPTRPGEYGKSYVSKHADRMGDGFSFGLTWSLFADMRTEVSKWQSNSGFRRGPLLSIYSGPQESK